MEDLIQRAADKKRLKRNGFYRAWAMEIISLCIVIGLAIYRFDWVAGLIVYLTVMAANFSQDRMRRGDKE